MLAEKLGIQAGTKNIPREILIEVGRGPNGDDDPDKTKMNPEEESGKEGILSSTSK